MPDSLSIVVEKDIPVAMRDGTILRTDVYRPAEGGPFPVIMQRTPYNKETAALSLQQTDVFRAVRRGYAVVNQDVRGRFRSDGSFRPFHQEINDGYDAVEWAAAQPWSTGKVGMFGTSYVGATQWLAAVGAPPSLKAIVPAFTASDYYEGWTYQGGAFQWGFMLNWVLPYLTTADLIRKSWREDVPDFAERREAMLDTVDFGHEVARTLPLKDFPVDNELSPYFAEWLSHPSRDEFWTSCSIEERHDNVRVPALSIAGWYDIFLDGSIRNYNGVREKGATEEARTGQRLLLGPWTHTTPPLQQSGAVDFGNRAGQGAVPLSMDVDGEHLRFFDYWLKGIDEGYSDEAPIRLFVMGENVWRDEHEWPLARAVNTDYYLSSGGKANTISGDGTLTTVAPGDERADIFLYDPNQPAPTIGGQLCCYPSNLPPGAFDQRPVEARSDVLMYVTPPLETDVEVTGPISLTLWAATDAPDTDFTGKLVDIYPDGYSRNLTDGIIRARYKDGTDQARPITPGEPTEYTINLWPTSNLFKAGHRIGLEVSSSNFPRFDRNLNTGHELGQDAEMRPAVQTIFHDAEHPSRVTLPIVPR
ncbi:MAG: CocE/NonD family hydrolase [Thermomicrobiales bacterium]